MAADSSYTLLKPISEVSHSTLTHIAELGFNFFNNSLPYPVKILVRIRLDLSSHPGREKVVSASI